MAYGGRTPRYQIPYITVGDVIDAASEETAARTIESQLQGLINAHSGGNGLFKIGNFVGIFASGDSTVQLSSPAAAEPALEGFINQIFVRVFSTIQWTGLPDNSVLYLYAALVETDTQSSRFKGDIEAIWNDTGITPPNSVLVAKATTTSISITVDTDPPGRINLETVATHAAENVNPHGATLYQDNIVTSGLSVLGTLESDQVVVNGNITIGGTATFLNGLEVFGTAIFNDDVTVSGIGQFLGDSIFSGTMFANGVAQFANLVATSGIENRGDLVNRGDILLTSGALVDGRDISADGVRLDTHVANIGGNPHGVTIEQLSGVSIFGGQQSTLLGNLPFESGVTVDGIDPSELSFLLDGSNADAVFAGQTLIRHGHTHNMSGVAIDYYHESPEYIGSVLSGQGIGFMDVRREQDGNGDYRNVYRWRPDPMNLTSGVVQRIGNWTQIGVRGNQDWLSGIELDIGTPGLVSNQTVDVKLYDSDFNEVGLVNNLGLQSASISTKIIGIQNPTAAVYRKGGFFSVLTELSSTSGSDVFIADLRVPYRTVFPGEV
jgi:hypothetical protein